MVSKSLFQTLLISCLLVLAAASFRPSDSCNIRRFRFRASRKVFIAVVRCQCYDRRTKVDSVLRSDSGRITKKLLRCARDNADDIAALCMEKDQSTFPVRVLDIAEKCCHESGGTLVGDVCN